MPKIWKTQQWPQDWKRTDFILRGSKMTADGDCSNEIKTLAPWKKSYDKPRQCIKAKTIFCQGPIKVKAMSYSKS